LLFLEKPERDLRAGKGTQKITQRIGKLNRTKSPYTGGIIEEKKRWKENKIKTRDGEDQPGQNEEG